jgi:hypothetical protein
VRPWLLVFAAAKAPRFWRLSVSAVPPLASVRILMPIEPLVVPLAAAGLDGKRGRGRPAGHFGMTLATLKRKE